MQSYYSVTQSYITRAKDLSSNDKVVYGLLSSLMTKYGHCWAKNKFIAEEVGMSVRIVQRSLERMKKLKYIVVEIQDHNYRKIYTAETYATRELTKKNVGEEEIQSKNLYVRQECHGVCQERHTPAIYKVLDTKLNKKKEDKQPPPTSSSPPFFSKKNKKSEAKQSEKKELTPEESQALENQMGKDLSAKYTKNALAHLKKCPKSAYHKKSLFEIVTKFYSLDQEAKSKSSEEKINSGKKLVSEVIKLNHHVKGHIIQNNSDVDVGKPTGTYSNCFKYDDPKLRSSIVTFLLRLGKPYKMPPET